MPSDAPPRLRGTPCQRALTSCLASTTDEGMSHRRKLVNPVPTLYLPRPTPDTRRKTLGVGIGSLVVVDPIRRGLPRNLIPTTRGGECGVPRRHPRGAREDAPWPKKGGLGLWVPVPGRLEYHHHHPFFQHANKLCACNPNQLLLSQCILPTSYGENAKCKASGYPNSTASSPTSSTLPPLPSTSSQGHHFIFL